MKFLLVIVLLLALLVGAAAVYLVMTVPTTGALIRFPLNDSQKKLLARVPANAEAFALVPSPSVLERKMKANPATRDAVEAWLERQALPAPWLLGDADGVIWRTDKQTSFAIRFDPVRALIARVWLAVAPSDRAEWEGSMLVIEQEPSAGSPLTGDLEALAATLPPGDLFVVQRGRSREYPPIGRPAVSTVTISVAEITIVSRAAVEEEVPARAVQPRFPRGAMLSVVFAEAPRVLGDLSRILGTNVSGLVQDGGAVALYDVDAGTLLPRPRGVIVIPAAATKAEELERVRRVAELVGEVRQNGTDALVSFDTTSVGRYVREELNSGPWPANRWALRIDPGRLIPVIEDLEDSRGLRFLAPRLHRSIRDLNRWAGALEKAKAIDAADSVNGGVEELRARIESK